MLSKGIMIQGTASTVGKSFLCTALCRIFTQDGYETNPFKAQNMSLNSFITATGGEMGRAQVVQAEACKKLPDILMNPILLKPSSEKRSQIILNGKVYAVMDAMQYYEYKTKLAPEIKKTYQALLNKSDIIVLEGAGSPAEINLKQNDIVNMGMAEMAKAPVILVGDIDKGGVFASLIGTLFLLTEKERKMVKGILINKFRGDIKLLQPGIEELEKRTGIPVLGVIPMTDIQIEEEDSDIDFTKYQKEGVKDLDVGIIRLPYLSNFTDIHALALEPGTKVRFIQTREQFGQPDFILLPGTKSTVAALDFLKKTGLDTEIKQAYQKGAFVFGICGGYQMMGKEIIDKENIESHVEMTDGLGLLDIKTVFIPEKTTTLSYGTERMFQLKVEGYEIHMGQEIRGKVKPFLKTNQGTDGAMTEDQRAIGTYFHGIFDNGAFTRNYLNYIRKEKGHNPLKGPIIQYREYKEEQYNKLADLVRSHVDMEKIYEIVRKGI